MLREQRRKHLQEALSKHRNSFGSFQFQDGSHLNDDDLLLIKQIGFPETQTINYQHSSLTAAGVKILCEAYPQATELELSNSPIKDEATLYIAQLFHLIILKLRNTSLTAIGMRSFTAGGVKNLIEVQFNQNNIGQKGCQLITRGEWPYLRSIYLTNCGIDDNGALHLSKAVWIDFQTLYLMDNRITKNGVVALKKANWKKLQTFNIQNSMFQWWFRMIEFYPHAFDKNCNFSFRRLEKQRMMMSVSSRFHGYNPF